MIQFLLPSILLSFFGLFNLLGISYSFFQRQLIAIIFGLITYFVTRKIGRYFFFNNSPFFYYFSVFLLLITYIIGLEIKGAKRWVDLYFFQFQPSEIFKVFFILYLARLFSSPKINYRQKLIQSFIYFIIPTMIIFKQPDLGNALVFGFIYFIFLLFSDIPKKIIFRLIIVFILLAPFFWFLIADYQKARIISFLNPQLDRQGIAYNMNQSIITIGSGKFLGKGLGAGTQSRLRFLPENKTDFAFASLVEQFGFLGALIVIFSFSFIFYQLIKRIIENIYTDRENFFYYIGVLSYIFFQFFVNTGMNLGILPVAGIALPLISYGGTSIITFFFALALI